MNSNPLLDPMSRLPMVGVEELYVLVLLGILLIGGFALFVYSIVAKRYWLTTMMLILPVGLVAVLGLAFVGFQPRMVESARSSNEATLTTAQDNASPIPDGVWENNPTANIYPSVALCGRPLAFQVAKAVRSEKRKAKRFAVTFVKEKHPGDHDQWKPPQDFCLNFGDEFVKQFPGSTVVFPPNRKQKKPKRHLLGKTSSL